MANRARRIASALLLAGLACGFALPVAAETFVVQMTSIDFEPQFVPADLSIRPGDTVQWVNTDPSSIDHSTCSGAGSTDPELGSLWNSGVLSASETFEITFDDEGEFEYFSILHEFEGMFGVIRVSDGSTGIGEFQESSWSRIKNRFADFLPRE